MRFALFFLILGLFPAYAGELHASKPKTDSACLVESVRQATVLSFKPFIAAMKSGDAMAELRLQSSEPFRAFLKQKNVVTFGALPEHEQDRLVEEYFEERFRVIGAHLEPIQAESLSQALARHGWAANSENAYSRLRELSHGNVNRILGTRRYHSSPAMRDAERIVADLNFEFIHNTTSDFSPKSADSLILSSKRIAELGFAGGLNSKLAFNSEFLRTGDQVYFFVVPSVKQKGSSFASEYGSKEIWLTSRFAQERAWISPFVMYPRELFMAMASFAPREFEEAVVFFKQRFPSQWETALHNALKEGGTATEAEAVGGLSGSVLMSFMTSHYKTMEAALAKSHALDFTVTDFAHLSRELALLSLDRIRQEDPARFESLISELKDEKPGLLGKFLQEVYKSHGLPGRYELKVPAAVPKSEIRN